MAGVEKRSSSVESPNKSELGLDLAGATEGFVVLGFEENNSSSSFLPSNRSAPFLGAVDLSGKHGQIYLRFLGVTVGTRLETDAAIT